MRLLNARTKRLEIHEPGSCLYAIVSHRWGADTEEVLFTDICFPSLAQEKEGYDKILGACNQALQDGFEYVWLDTCCIQRSDSTELAEALNSMYTWYQGARVCYAYLRDVSEMSQFSQSEWFKRGWTLQELIAPQVLKFFNKDWKLLGSREELMEFITAHTGITMDIFACEEIPRHVSIAQRMFWASKRETKKIEDRAYSLLGILGIHLPAIYGIGKSAFEKLQQEIMLKSRDQTLFAWKLTANRDGDSGLSNATGLLAPSPTPYQNENVYQIPVGDFYPHFDMERVSRFPSSFSLKNGAIRIKLPMRVTANEPQADAPNTCDVHEALLRCSLDPPCGLQRPQRPLMIYLKYIPEDDQYARVHIPTSWRSLSDDSMTSFTLQKVDVCHSATLNPPWETRTPIPPNSSSPSQHGTPISPNSSLPSQHGTPTSPNSGSPSQHGYTFASPVSQSCTLPGVDQDTSQPTVHAIEGQGLPAPGVGATTSIDNIQLSINSTYLEDRHVVPAFPHFRLRHPPGTEIVNIIICGEPGAGAGEVINMLVGKDVVDPRTEIDCAAMTFTTYDISIDSRNVRIFYIVGPQDHKLDAEGHHAALDNVMRLAQELHDDGGIHLLVCCMFKTKLNWNIHSLFYQVLCAQVVPTVILLTDIGREGLEVDLKGMGCDDHACISVDPPSSPEEIEEYRHSVQTVRQLLIKYVGRLGQAYIPQIGRSMMHSILEDFMPIYARCAMTLSLLIEAWGSMNLGL